MADHTLTIEREMQGLRMERSKLERRIAEIDMASNMLLRIVNPDSKGPLTGNNALLKEFFLHSLRDGARSSDELREMAEMASFDFHNKAAGRVVHFCLLNLQNAGEIIVVEGRWALPSANEDKGASKEAK